jgi:hypothetical protein
MHEPVSDQAKTGAAWYIVALAYAAGEPVQNTVGLEKIVQETVSALGGTPANICAASVGGKAGKIQTFSPDNFAALLSSPQSGALTISGLRESTAHVDLRLYLRHNPAVAMKYQPPGVLYFVAECGGGALSPKAAQGAAREFLRACAAELQVLHGGAIAFPNRNQALSEASLIGHDMPGEPESFVKRWHYDASNSMSLWQKARHVYWLTLLGPALAQQAGGAVAANASGAVEVMEKAGSLIFAATRNIEDSLDPNFSRKTRKLREWLWPYLIQNPH